jgi:hypothetical protein
VVYVASCCARSNNRAAVLEDLHCPAHRTTLSGALLLAPMNRC